MLFIFKYSIASCEKYDKIELNEIQENICNTEAAQRWNICNQPTPVLAKNEFHVVCFFPVDGIQTFWNIHEIELDLRQHSVCIH